MLFGKNYFSSHCSTRSSCQPLQQPANSHCSNLIVVAWQQQAVTWQKLAASDNDIPRGDGSRSDVSNIESKS
ncbi:Myosin-I heavy chain [Bienertia sinuspersici]